MKLKPPCCVIAVLLLMAVSFSGNHAQTKRGARPQKGKVCGDPTQACKSFATFEPNDLPFRIKEGAVIWESEPFYAIILKSMLPANDDCDQFISEDERLAAQALFPNRKVFTSRCEGSGTLYYTGVDGKYRFMAVYAGATKAEAARMLETVKATGKFNGANIRRLSAGFNGT